MAIFAKICTDFWAIFDHFFEKTVDCSMLLNLIQFLFV